MKKSKLLMLLPAFVLVGCSGSKLSNEEAKEKAAQIAEKQKELGPKKQIRVEYSDGNQSSLYHVDVEAQRYYLKTESEETWFYKGSEEEKTYYSVQHTFEKDGEPEVKEYSKFTGTYADTMEEVMASAYLTIPETYSEYPVEWENSSVEVPGAKYEQTISSKGDGHLKVEAEAEVSENGVSYSAKSVLEWEDYYLVYCLFEESEGTESHKLEAKISYDAAVSLPDLSSYSEKGSL